MDNNDHSGKKADTIDPVMTELLRQQIEEGMSQGADLGDGANPSGVTFDGETYDTGPVIDLEEFVESPQTPSAGADHSALPPQTFVVEVDGQEYHTGLRDDPDRQVVAEEDYVPPEPATGPVMNLDWMKKNPQPAGDYSDRPTGLRFDEDTIATMPPEGIKNLDPQDIAHIGGGDVNEAIRIIQEKILQSDDPEAIERAAALLEVARKAFDPSDYVPNIDEEQPEITTLRHDDGQDPEITTLRHDHDLIGGGTPNPFTPDYGVDDFRNDGEAEFRRFIEDDNAEFRKFLEGADVEFESFMQEAEAEFHEMQVPESGASPSITLLSQEMSITTLELDGPPVNHAPAQTIDFKLQ